MLKVLDSPEEMQVSKSRKLPVLVDPEEMEGLFARLGEFYIFDGSRPVTEEEMCISHRDFLDAYCRYVEGIKKGKLIDEATIRPFFSSLFTRTKEVVYALRLSNGKFLVKPLRPIVQLKRHHFIFTDKLHSGVMGPESVTWGIEFSYPQLFLDPQTKKIGKVEKNGQFPNTELFKTVAQWVRDATKATPFLGKGTHPIRLGKQCFSWIHHHPSLGELHVGKDPSTPH